AATRHGCAGRTDPTTSLPAQRSKRPAEWFAAGTTEKMARENISTSRVGRSATIGRLAAGQAVKQFGTRAANLARGDEASDAALARRQVETAEQIVAVLGTMKGAAMKLGQVMSFLDVGLVPEEYREDFQRKLAELRDSAPQVAFKEMRKVIEAEFEEPLDELFEQFETEGIAQEIRLRIDEELDYELEASNQRAMARIFRGHPFIYVPEVIGSLSRERVMVSELIAGTRFEELKEMDAPARNRIAEIVFRFYFGCMYRHHQFSGDPHPGNFMLLADGRVAFLDFGLYKRLPPELAEYELQIARLGITGQGDALIEHLHAGGFLANPDRSTPEQILRQFEDVTWGYTRDAEVELTPEIATQIVIDMSDPRSRHYAAMRHENLPADHLFGRRPVGPPHRDPHPRRDEPAARQRQLAPDRARVDLRRSAGDRARPRRGRLLRLYRVWICSRLVVPGTPLGRPAV